METTISKMRHTSQHLPEISTSTRDGHFFPGVVGTVFDRLATVCTEVGAQGHSLELDPGPVNPVDRRDDLKGISQSIHRRALMRAERLSRQTLRRSC